MALNNFLSSEEILKSEQERLSDFRGGRSTLFDRFLAGQQQFRGLSGGAQRVAQDRFDPLSARFVLEQIQSPGSSFGGESGGENQGNFNQFLQGQFNPFDRNEFQNQFQNIQGLFNPNQEGQTEQQRSKGESIRALFQEDNDAVARNVITQYFLQGINPLLRSASNDILKNRISAFRDQDASTGLFQQFLGKGLGGGVGGGFFG